MESFLFNYWDIIVLYLCLFIICKMNVIHKLYRHKDIKIIKQIQKEYLTQLQPYKRNYCSHYSHLNYSFKWVNTPYQLILFNDQKYCSLFNDQEHGGILFLVGIDFTKVKNYIN